MFKKMIFILSTIFLLLNQECFAGKGFRPLQAAISNSASRRCAYLPWQQVYSRSTNTSLQSSPVNFPPASPLKSSPVQQDPLVAVAAAASKR